MKRVFTVAFTLTVLYFACCRVSAEPIVSADSAIVFDCASKRVLYEKNAHEKRGMASTTKIMTALIALERLDTESIVSVSANASSTEGSSIWLSPGEKMSVNDLLYAVMLASGNDAATALAEYTAGSVDAFAVLMNIRAKEMGAYNTHFSNPHGLPDDNHYTTAYDLGLIAIEAMENELFCEIVATRTKTISWEGSQWDRSLTNHNKLLNRYEYATGIKTGYTKKAGRCLVSSANKNGHKLVAVTLSAPDDWNDHIKMLDYCFDTYEPFTICSEGASAGEVEVENADKIGAAYEKTFRIALTEDEKNRIRTEKTFDITFPVVPGQTIGKYDIYFSGEHIAGINIVAKNKSDKSKNIFIVIKNLLKGLAAQ